MTTIDTAALRHALGIGTRALAGAAIALGLAGCSGGSLGNLLGSNDPPTETGATDPSAAAVAPGRLAVAPVIGPPETVAKPLQAQLTTALEKQKIGIAKAPAEKADYTLRGYIVSASDKGGTKVSYIWDVTDAAEKRVNRITGEEIVSGAPGKNPWSSVTPEIMQKIADKTAGSVATWLPSQAPQAASAPAKETAPGKETKVAAASPETAASSAGPAAGGPATAVVADIVGAPGDGNAALKLALRRELTKGGLTIADTPGAGAYRVEGKVQVGESKDGKQPIQIDWTVKDAKGKTVGNVAQKNDIQQGSLDQSWGKTADLAAAAAAQGILKLLPPAKS